MLVGGVTPSCTLTALVFVSRFYLGGPTSIRGFGMYSIGPQSEGTKTSE